MTEKEIERYLRKRVDHAGGWAMKFISPGLTGVPDRVILFPEGRITFIEVKAPGQRLRKLQESICNRIRSFGFDVRLIDTKEKVDSFIGEVLSDGI